MFLNCKPWLIAKTVTFVAVEINQLSSVNSGQMKVVTDHKIAFTVQQINSYQQKA